MIQNHLIWKRQSDLERDEIEGIVVEIMPEKAKSFFIFVMYRPRIRPSFYIQSVTWYFVICYLNYLSKSVFSWEIPTLSF